MSRRAHSYEFALLHTVARQSSVSPKFLTSAMNATAGTLGVHDAGGATDFGARLSLEGALEKSREAFAQWEIEVCSLAIIMSKKGFRVVDESRRTMELLPPARYGTLSYWCVNALVKQIRSCVVRSRPSF